VTETSDQVPKSWFMILLQNTYRDLGKGQILTTTRINKFMQNGEFGRVYM